MIKDVIKGLSILLQFAVLYLSLGIFLAQLIYGKTGLDLLVSFFFFCIFLFRFKKFMGER